MARQLIAPVLVVLVGLAWLLNALNVLDDVDWMWTVGLAAAGIATLAAGGINRFTVVLGPFLLLASAASVFRQTGRLPVNLEIPLLTIALGVLWMLAVVANVPLPVALQSEKT